MLAQAAEATPWYFHPGFVALVAIVPTAVIGYFQLRRTARHDEQAKQGAASSARRDDLDILLGGYEQLLRDKERFQAFTKKELEEAIQRALECEEHEEALKDRVDLLEREVRRLGGNV